MTYRERREARAERLREWAEKRERDGRQHVDSAHRIQDGIPLGQPILVGHHSERGHRRDLDRIDRHYQRGFESMDKADKMRSRADSIDAQADHAIYSDDEDAVERLEERIAKLETKQARMKEINAAIRKGISLDTLALTDREKADLMSVARIWGKKGYPSYALTNNNAQIRRYKGRLKEARNPRPARHRWLTVRYGGECDDCGAKIERGDFAGYNRESRTLRCETCMKGG